MRPMPGEDPPGHDPVSALALAQAIMREIPRQHTGRVLTPRMLALLIALETGPRTSLEIRDLFSFSQATTSEAIAELREVGYVDTAPLPRDRRVVLITITAKGLRLRRLRRG